VIGTTLYWVDGPWPGRLALAARPRGGEWLEDELSAWERAGVDAVLSLLTPEEEHDLALTGEEQQARERGLKFLSLPIEDREVPEKESEVRSTVERVNSLLSRGENVVVHCRQGVGRTGLLAACLLVSQGLAPDAAVAKLSATRGVPVPETQEQRKWIDGFAANAKNLTRI
jgi:protein-tyrosine phosphatase